MPYFQPPLPRFAALPLLFLAAAAGALDPAPAAVPAAPPALPPSDSAVAAAIEAEPVPEAERRRRWYFFAGMINAYPRLNSEVMIENYFDPIMANLAPGYDAVTKVSDVRDLGLIWQPQFGVGYVVNDYLSVAVQAGYGEGKVITEADDRSIFLLPLHHDFEIRRGAAFIGTSIDVHPFGMAELRKFDNWRDRFRGIRPSLGGRMTWTYALFKARVRVALKPLPNIGINLSDYWFIGSFGANAGITMPLNERIQFAGNAGYNWFLEESQDFNAYSISLEWRYFFR